MNEPGIIWAWKCRSCGHDCVVGHVGTPVLQCLVRSCQQLENFTNRGVRSRPVGDVGDDVMRRRILDELRRTVTT